MVIDPAVSVLRAGSLDNEDILAPNGVLDLAATLANRELGEDSVAGGHTQHCANVIHQLGMGIAPEDDNVANHRR